MSRRWPTVLFDLDGTLADTIGLIVASYQHTLQTVLGETVTEDAARSWIGRPLLPVLEEISPDHAVEMDRVYREWNLANHDRLLRSFDGLTDLLADLHDAGVALGVVTSKRRDTAVRALAGVGLAGSIDVVAALEDTTEHKPGPAPLLHGAGVLGADPHACVYVGDATVDVLAAGAAGMASVAVTWGAGTPADLAAAGADHVCATVAELRALLGQP